MARRMKLQGADVKMVVEIMPYSGGLKRNIVQCLEDFNIPLKLSHTVIDIDGKDRVRGVTVARVDGDGKPLADTEEYISCDTLLLSCGLIPENELSKDMGLEMDEVTQGPVVNSHLETTCRGVFACGNVLHVHDLVDHVSEEGRKAGRSAAAFIIRGKEAWGQAVRPGIPPKSKFVPPKERDLDHQLICIGCPKGCFITVHRKEDGNLEVSGNSCPVGDGYARKEMTSPTRIITSLIKVTGGAGRVVSVKTASDVPKAKIAACMEQIGKTRVSAPVSSGDILIADVAGTGVNIVATANISI
jgi:CxxC motif-containing protein